ncbi:hypothetical protein D9758_003982 [Tetrapyrgos nigripes]|uniref:ABC transporter n=1 Tax=Tetrapyrgos nigripes TaxID=182062 RepID=A0A8H5LR78_9AGAR|nr:hypothetical protein D9758_003982 [Tetrapyrgos nigripes]
MARFDKISPKDDEEKVQDPVSQSRVDADVDISVNKSSWRNLLIFSRNPPPPPKLSVEDAELVPEATAGPFDIITFSWLTPLLSLGYQRPLEDSDLYKLQDERNAAHIGGIILESFDRRRKNASDYNERLARGDISPGWRSMWWTLKGNRETREKEWREKTGRKKASLVWAMNDSVKWFFWTGGIFKVIGDTAQITSPLLVKAIIKFATESYTNHREGRPTPPVGQGIGMAFGLLALTLLSSLCTHHFFYRGAGTGVLLRGGLIAAIYSRSMRLTARARSKLPNAQIMNHISTDVSRIDFCAGFFHMFWAAPIQMIICLILLILNLGPSALAGFAFFVLASPLQTWTMKKMFSYRLKSMAWTDKRAKLLQELLSGMRIIKFFAWEIPFLNRLADIRRRELKHVCPRSSPPACRKQCCSDVLTSSCFGPVICHIFTGWASAQSSRYLCLLDPFQSAQIAFDDAASLSDAYSATQRLYAVFEAETLDVTRIIDDTLDVAIEVKAAAFTWDAPPPEPTTGKKGKKSKKTAKPTSSDEFKSVEPFRMRDISLTIPRGQLVAIVGQVGAGKSSLLQGIIGEMRRTSGTVKFGGSVGYCPQSAWIQNATIRQNICFGRPFEEARYWKAVKDSCLEPDLDMLPYGDMTEVGEKGVSLSGGQKQRLSICRAIYCDTDIQIFDDPLSALDAHVGKAVFHNVLRDAMAGKTRVLVTHALHFLPQVDYIYVVSDGRILERGTYTELMENGQQFSAFVREFGSKDGEGEQSKEEDSVVDEKAEDEVKKKFTTGAAIMQAEERNTGAVDMAVYKQYSEAARGNIILPFLVFSLVLVQGSTVMSSYWLVWWQENEWPQPQGFYMGIYAALGVIQALSMFLMGSTFALMTYFASQSLHKSAIGRVMKAPMSFFETTPLGRIMNRFSKDIDTIDNMLGDSFRMLVATSSNILGAIILVSVILPWFLIAVVVIMSVYIYAAHFYRASARELKRLDAILRSSLYSHFSESLSGLTTIRAHGETERFRLDNEKRIDIENRAYWLTVTNQRWLGIRLDFLGMLLTFTVSLLTIGTRFSISPSQTGVVLSYILSIQQAFGWLVRQSAEVENNMNAVERVVHYGQHIEQEAPHELPDSKPPAPWPSQGRIEFKDVVLRYRPELPPVLKGISLNVKAGEKIGIVGRTGAGKSSLMTAIFRLVELDSGYIKIDDVDISKVGLTDLRSGLSIIPQDPLLFSGTLRSNLDPFNLHDDAKLWDALKRSYLVENEKRVSLLSTATDESIPSGSHTPVNRFTLDSVVEDEGGNLSIGQRSLVSLARALVKDTKILILDEATASVDYETDRKIQDTIAQEFTDRTILCIAHRLRTIIGYDRICVLDAGQVAEFDTPTQLFEQNGIFKGMCDRSSITLDDIRLSRKLSMDD